MHRLYAIDINVTMRDRTVVAWVVNFERESHSPETSSTLRFKPKHPKSSYSQQDESSKAAVIWDDPQSTLYVSVPSPGMVEGSEDGLDMLYAIRDEGNITSMVYKMAASAVNMVMFDTTHGPVNAADQLWISQSGGKLVAIEKSGKIGKIIDLQELVKANLTITSKISTTRARFAEEDFFVFGINVPQPTNEFLSLAADYGVDVSKDKPHNYVVGIDTPENAHDGMPLAWMVATPEDLRVFGQIVGVPGDANTSDQIIVYAQETEIMAKIFSIGKSL